MKIREEIISDLSRHLLGPLNGIEEKIPEDSPYFKGKIKPISMYITGILSPPQRDLEDLPGTDDQGYTIDSVSGESGDIEGANDQIDQELSLNDYNPLELSPFGYPSSMGLAFLVRRNSQISPMKVCITWGTYERKIDTEKGNYWQRIPHSKIFSAPIGEKIFSLNDESENIRIFIRQKEISKDEYYVYISLINDSKGDWKNISEYMFQTQIRIVLNENGLLPLRKKRINFDEYSEESVLEQNYSKLRSYAKGRITSAIWKELDPIQNEKGVLEGSSIFDWPDKMTIPDEHKRQEFLQCDVRTEWLPTYQHKAPSKTIDSTSEEYKFNPLDLAKISDPKKLRKTLSPLLDAYQAFIYGQTEQVENETGRGIVETLQNTYQRMEDGINYLESNNDARLAFNFANKAMSLQQQWNKKTVFDWYPFQLGFILQIIKGLSDQDSENRKICDLLWFPTGGGKTEAYLALVAYILAYRRLRGLSGDRKYPEIGVGTAIISRYTLRLLTIQQFRRAAALIMACEYLRRTMWGPEMSQIWGDDEFSLGLWVGGNVTPNSLPDSWFRRKKISGALELLKNRNTKLGDSEPAQLLNCPSCGTILSIPYQKLAAEPMEFYLTTEQKIIPELPETDLKALKLKELSGEIVAQYKYSQILKVNVTPLKEIEKKDFQRAFDILIRSKEFPKILCCDVTRPGYFFDLKRKRDRRFKEVDFKIFCPNPTCDLLGEWDHDLSCFDPKEYKNSFSYFLFSNKNKVGKFPFPIYTVDEHLYRTHPSFIISTVDKFARMAFLPTVGTFFGKIPRKSRYYNPKNSSKVFRAPDLFIQDELHLIEGPLGSMVGIYEVAISLLCELDGWIPKYVTATATIKNAASQVKALYRRSVSIFPPLALHAENNFFARSPEVSQRDEEGASRLYLGACISGLSPQTTGMFLWGSLLQIVKNKIQTIPTIKEKYDPYWTIVGYFNSRRELAAASNLIRQDVVEFLGQRWGVDARYLDPNDSIELSSRINSIRLPSLLERISSKCLTDDSVHNTNTVVATSILGTGIDIDRLGLMIVHGQPKTTSQYIQSTGRVGRKDPGIVISFLRSARIRDMDHFENFVGYHRSLYKSVEPVPIYPFSPGVIENSLGPVLVSILRNLKPNSSLNFSLQWEEDPTTILEDIEYTELSDIVDYIIKQKNAQPSHLQPTGDLNKIINSKIDRWKQIAVEVNQGLRYSETGKVRATSHVVLGDFLHETEDAHKTFRVVFPLAPNSLRTMEPTICLRT